MRMRMIDLFPQRLVEQLRQRFGEAYDRLPHEQQAALMIAAVENTVTRGRLLALQQIHPSDASQCLAQLVSRGFLEKTGSSRGAVYHLSGIEIPGPEEVFDSPNLELCSPNLPPDSPNLEESYRDLGRDAQGRLISASHQRPFVDDLKQLTPEYLESLEKVADVPRKKKKIPRHVMQDVLLELLDNQYVTVSCLAELVSRDAETLRGQYLSQMVKEGRVDIAFPRTPNDPRQAYTKGA
jgi:hypothetical protein